MEGYQERSHSIAVPKNTGIDGFLRALRGILVLPRVRNINIDATGAVRYTRYVRNDEPDSPVGVDYTGLEPWSIIRNGDLEEIPIPPATPAPNVIAYMFNRLVQDSLVPVALVTGAASEFWHWHERTARVRLARAGAAYGLPIYTDRQVPDHALVLCAAYVKGGSLIDCHRFLKVEMSDPGFVPPETSVEIL
jgi:hypothetical protein